MIFKWIVWIDPSTDLDCAKLKADPNPKDFQSFDFADKTVLNDSISDFSISLECVPGNSDFKQQLHIQYTDI